MMNRNEAVLLSNINIIHASTYFILVQKLLHSEMKYPTVNK